MYNKKTCHNAETNMSPRKRQKKYKKNQILSVVMAIACTVVTPASDVALSMAFMTQTYMLKTYRLHFLTVGIKMIKMIKKTIKIIQAQEIQIQTKTLVIQAIQVLNQPQHWGQ